MWCEAAGLRRGKLSRYRPLLSNPCRQTTVENRCAITKAEIIQCEINPRCRRHPILTEVKHDARVVIDAVLFKHRFQLIDWKQFEQQAGTTRRRDVTGRNELRALNV